MTQDRMLTCEDPRKLLTWLRADASDRKLRLFTVAFWREWWIDKIDPATEDGPDLDVVELLNFGEEWAERGVPPEICLSSGYGFKWHPLAARSALDAANWTIRQTTGFKSRLDCLRRDVKDRTGAAERQMRLLREVFGHVIFRVACDPVWLTPTVLALAQTAYDERAFARLPILADALEEAGCTNVSILAHCRGPGPHVRGCWVVDLALGKE